MRWVSAHRTEWLTHLSFGVMDVGTTVAGLGVCALVAAVFVVRLRLQWVAAAGVVAFVVGGLLASGLKHLFDRPRPPADLALITVGGASFPSTQATETAAVAAALLIATTWPNRTSRCAATLAALLVLAGIGGCMVYLGAHWSTDVLAGWALGACLGSACGWAARKMMAMSGARG